MEDNEKYKLFEEETKENKKRNELFFVFSLFFISS